MKDVNNDEYYSTPDKTMQEATTKVGKLLAEPGMVMFTLNAVIVDPTGDGFNIVSISHFGDRDDMDDPVPSAALQISEAIAKQMLEKGAGMLQMIHEVRGKFEEHMGNEGKR